MNFVQDIKTMSQFILFVVKVPNSKGIVTNAEGKTLKAIYRSGNNA